MALERWSILEYVQRISAKLNMPVPSDLTTATLQGQSTLSDLVDAVNDMAQHLMLRMWPDEIIKYDTIRSFTSDTDATATLTNDSTTVVIDASTLTNATDLALHDPFDIWCAELGGVHEVTSAYLSGGDITGTLDRAFQGTTNDYTVTVGDRRVDLPDDFHRLVTDPNFASTSGRLKILTQAQFANSRQTIPALSMTSLTPGKPLYGVINYATNGLYLYPEPDQEYDIRITYYHLITAYDSTADGADATAFYFPIPAEHQSILIDMVMAEMLSTNLESEQYRLAANKVSQRLADISSDQGEGRIGTRMTPRTYRGRRRLGRRGRSMSPDEWERT